MGGDDPLEKGGQEEGAEDDRHPERSGAGGSGACKQTFCPVGSEELRLSPGP